MELSIVIPTYNRAYLLERLVRAIFSQSYQDFEVIVSNDGSTDDTELVISRLQEENGKRLVLKSGPNEGRANARNRGASFAKGKIILFFDDDVMINPSTIIEHVQFHKKNHAENLIADGPALYNFNKLKGDFQVWRATREHSWYKQENEPVLKNSAGLVGANKSMKTSFLMRTGGLKAGLNDSEDFEFAYRAMHKYGAKIYTLYNAWVFHEDYKSLVEYVKRYKAAMISAKNLYLANPDIISTYPERWVFDPPAHMKVLAPVFSKKKMINFTSSQLFLRLPKVIRWKIYEWIVTSYAWYTV